MNIDKIEKMNTFPSPWEYVKINFNDNITWIFLIMFFAFYILSLPLGILFFFIISISDYILDKKIFKAFSRRKDQ